MKFEKTGEKAAEITVTKTELVLIGSVAMALVVWLFTGLPLLFLWPSVGVGVTSALLAYVVLMVLFTAFGDGGEVETLTANEDDADANRIP